MTPQTPSNHTFYHLEIPTAAFSDTPNNPPPNRTPPTPSPSPSPPRSTIWRHRQRKAAARRAALHLSTTTRCRRHVNHALTTARAVKSARTSSLARRRAATTAQLARAESRRSALHSACQTSYLCSPSDDAHTQLQKLSLSTPTPTPAPAQAPTFPSQTQHPRLQSHPPKTKQPSSSTETQHHPSTPISPASVVIPPTNSHLSLQTPSPQQSLRNNHHTATAIASHYLLARAKHLLRYTGLLPPAVNAASFPEITARLQTTLALNAATTALRAIALHPSRPIKTPPRPVHSRILLSSLLIATHPEILTPPPTTLSTPCTQSSPPLYAASKPVLTAARCVVASLHLGNPSALASAWPVWRTLLTAWKTQDANKLLKTLTADAVATHATINRLSSTLSAANDITSITNSLNLTLSPTTPSTPLPNQPSAPTSAALSAAVSAARNRLHSIRSAATAIAGNKAIPHIDAAITAHDRRRDQCLIHNLLLDANSFSATLCASATSVPPNAWSRLQTELTRQPPTLNGELPTRLAFLQTLLHHLGATSFQLPLDDDAVAGAVASRADAARFSAGVVNSVAEACRGVQAAVFDAPVEAWRVEAVRRLQEEGRESMGNIVATALRESTEVVGGIHRHVVQYRLRQTAQSVAEFGPAWERQQLSEYVAVHGRARTLEWVREGMRDGGGEVDVTGVVAAGIVRAVCGGVACGGNGVLPEVLWLDGERLQRVQNEVQRCCVSAGVTQVARGIVGDGGGGLGSVTALADRLMEVSGWEVVRGIDFEEVAVAWVREQTDGGDVGVLRGLVAQIVRGGGRVFDMMMGRVLRALREESGQAIRRGFGNEGEDERLRRLGRVVGLEGGTEVARVLSGVCKEVAMVGGHVVRVHGGFVQGVLQEACGVGEE